MKVVTVIKIYLRKQNLRAKLKIYKISKRYSRLSDCTVRGGIIYLFTYSLDFKRNINPEMLRFELKLVTRTEKHGSTDFLRLLCCNLVI